MTAKTRATRATRGTRRQPGVTGYAVGSRARNAAARRWPGPDRDALDAAPVTPQPVPAGVEGFAVPRDPGRSS